MEAREINLTVFPAVNNDDIIIIGVDIDRVDLELANRIDKSIRTYYPDNNILLLPKDDVQLRTVSTNEIREIIRYLEGIVKEREQRISS